jgi:thiazole synthase ThiGH ThiG subunit
MPDPLIVAGREFGSRLFLGTAGYPNRMLMLNAIAPSRTEMVTASIRRVSLAGEDDIPPWQPLSAVNPARLLIGYELDIVVKGFDVMGGRKVSRSDG